MLTYSCEVWRYFGEDGYKKPSVVARFCLEAIDSDTAEELAAAVVRDMPEVFVIVEDKQSC